MGAAAADPVVAAALNGEQVRETAYARVASIAASACVSSMGATAAADVIAAYFRAASIAASACETSLGDAAFDPVVAAALSGD